MSTFQHNAAVSIAPARARSVHAVAPLRISFVGGGTDFPDWYEGHGGAVLSTTIDHFVRVTATPRTDRQIAVRSLDLGQLVEYRLDEGPEFDGVMDLAKAAIGRIGLDTGLDVDIESEAPGSEGRGGGGRGGERGGGRGGRGGGGGGGEGALRIRPDRGVRGGRPARDVGLGRAVGARPSSCSPVTAPPSAARSNAMASQTTSSGTSPRPRT